MTMPSQPAAEHPARRVLSTVRDFREERTAAATLSSHLQRDLALDSLDIAELLVRVQEALGAATPAPPDRLDTVQDIVAWVEETTPSPSRSTAQ